MRPSLCVCCFVKASICKWPNITIREPTALHVNENKKSTITTATMKFVSTLLVAIISSAAAAPAIVWSGESGSVKHSSEVIDASKVLSSVVSQSSSTNVVFVVGRDENGSDGLTGLTSTGALPKIANKYADASSVHHYVRGIESFATLVRDAKASTDNVVETSLKDFANRDSSNAEKSVAADGSIPSAELFVVSVPADALPAQVDAAIAAAIEDVKVESVVLTAVRGISEVKLERDVNARKQLHTMQQKTARRRLEDGGNNGDGDDDSNDGIYFVNFTPNIFSGLLFFMFFTVTTYVGIGCMGNIAGQDVYVSKYPTIGREH